MNDKSELSDRAGLPESSTLSKEVVFRGKIWNVVRRVFNLHGESIAREYIEHPGAVAVLALNDSDEVLLINQYRAPVNQHLYEFPAGLLDVDGENHLEAAKRELLEETDYAAGQWELLQIFHTTPGSSSESIAIYLARELEQVEHNFARTAEEKHIEVSWVPFQDVLSAVQHSKLRSPTLVVGILALAAKRQASDD
jgi:ADP-ribose pyrophosphatase